MKMLLLASRGDVVQTKAYVELGTGWRGTCVLRVFHLPQEEPEKDKNKPKIYFSPRSPIFFLSFPSLYLCVHHLCSTFPFVVALPPSLLLFFIPGLLPFFPPDLSLCPIHLKGAPSLKRRILFSS